MNTQKAWADLYDAVQKTSAGESAAETAALTAS